MRIALPPLMLCALAMTACDPGPTSASDAPARYDRTGAVRLVVASRTDTNRACMALGNPAEAMACFALRQSGECTIYIPDPREIGATETGRTLDHELAHCGGWPPHHPR